MADGYNGPANPAPPDMQFPGPYDYLSQDQPDDSYKAPLLTDVTATTSFLTKALDAVGLSGYGNAVASPYVNSNMTATPIPPWAQPTFVPPVSGSQPQRVDRDPATYYMGQDPTDPTKPTSDITDDMVFMGKYTTEGVPQAHIGIPGEDPGSELAPNRQPDAITVSAAMNLPYNWSSKHTTEVMKKMRAAGMNVKDFSSMMNGWQMLVQRASRMFTLSGGSKQVTPWDVLGLVKKESKAAGLLDHNGNVIQTNTQRNVTDISDGEAWSAVRGAMESLLGRKPTDQEVRDYASQLNAMAAKNPSITTTRTVTNQNTGHSNTTTNTTGGFNQADATQAITDQIENTDEYAQVQSATTYFNALLGALGEVSPTTG